jgi:hypothetical protein
MKTIESAESTETTESTESTEILGRDGRQGSPAGPDPLTRQLLRLMIASRARGAGPNAPAPGAESSCQGLDAVAVMELVSAWHRRGVEVGFPELMTRPVSGGQGGRR